MLSPGSVIEAVPEKAVVGGRMLVRAEGGVVLVEGAIPSERVSVVVERRQQGVWLGRVVDVLEASPDRRDPGPDPGCGGMTFAHIAYGRQCDLKAAIVVDAMARIGKIVLEQPIAIAASPTYGYRSRYRVHARGGRLGFYREGTHEICDAGSSGQLAVESIDGLRAAEAGLASIDTTGIEAFEFIENVPNTERVVNLALDADAGFDPTVVEAMRQVPGLRGVTCTHAGSGRLTNLIGDGWVSDPVATLVPGEPPPGSAIPHLRRHAPSFFQANRFLVNPLVQVVSAWLADGPVVDLYAGVGLFAVCLAFGGRTELLAIESDPRSVDDLRWNARPFQPHLVVMGTTVEGFLRTSPMLRDATLIVDPPRVGMSRAAITAILAARARRIVYVSCDVATLARDARRLLDAGYHLLHLEALDLFPNTAHVEVVAVFGVPEPLTRAAGGAAHQ